MILAALCVFAAVLAGSGHAYSFDEDAALSALYYSFSAYCGEEHVKEWDCLYCQHNPYFQLLVPCCCCCPLLQQRQGIFANDSTEIFGYVGFDTTINTVFVVVRGSGRMTSSSSYQLSHFPRCKANIANWVSTE